MILLAAALLALSPAEGLALQAPPRVGPDRAVFRTPCGELVLELFPDAAPKSVAQFLALVRAGVYDGTRIFRIEPGFVVQVSPHTDRAAPLTPEQAALVRKLPLERNGLKHEAGSLSMARYDGNPDSAESSFSILLGPAPHLDGQYTVFGRLAAGHDVLELIAKLKSPSSREPRIPLPVLRAETALPGAPPARASVPAEALSTERLVLRTDGGDLVVALYPDVAPKTVARVLELARAGAYDGTRFRPAVPGSYLQALGHSSKSTPLSPAQSALVRRLPAEFSRLPHRRGELSMAREPNDPDSAESSFSIMLGDRFELDERYTVFGRVVAGEDVLRHLERLADTRPQFGATLAKAEVQGGTPDLAALRGPVSPPAASKTRLAALLAGWVFLLGVGGAMAWLPARCIPARTRTIVLVVVLIGMFPLFMASIEAIPSAADPAYGLAIFAAAVIFFRIMARFEGPSTKPPTPPPPSSPTAT
jgi:cyclophilin family peptidyl-prolyl cis-trans isomerase